MPRLHPIAHDISHAGRLMADYTSWRVNEAVTFLVNVYNNADGHTTRGESEGRSKAELTSPESAANTRMIATRELDQFHALKHQAFELIKQMTDLADHAFKLFHEQPAVPQKRLCGDGGKGKDGSLEWHDAWCDREAVSNGLCDMHRMRWVRWKRANGIDTTGDYAA